MATKAFQHLCFCIFLFSIVLPLASYANPSTTKSEKPSPFEFIKHLEGCHKGEKVKGLEQLKAYLENFGYLNYSQNKTHANDDDFDDLLEAAIKTYQLNYHLKTTGALDAQTVSQMTKPRCGVPDIINGTNWMRGGKKRPNHGHNGTIHTVSHYEFPPDKPRWPAGQTHLTYGFASGTGQNAIAAVTRAFNKWASSTHFTFSQANFGNANLKIGFYRLNHNDGAPFDGRGGTLAHAFFPPVGRFHYDGDESWVVGAVQDSIDLETVALHEIGHLLGLDHSLVENAIMYATILPGETKGLHDDDIQGIKALYDIA